MKDSWLALQGYVGISIPQGDNGGCVAQLLIDVANSKIFVKERLEREPANVASGIPRAHSIDLLVTEIPFPSVDQSRHFRRLGVLSWHRGLLYWIKERQLPRAGGVAEQDKESRNQHQNKEEA